MFPQLISLILISEGEDGEIVEEIIGPLPKAAVQLTRKDFGKVSDHI